MTAARKCLEAGCIFFLLLCLPPVVSAHGMHVFAWVEGDTCHVESYFSESRRARHAQVEVFDMNGKILLNGTTDADGNFSFAIPVRADLKIVVTPGMGHKGAYILRAKEMEAVAVKEAAGERPAPPFPSGTDERALHTAPSRGSVVVDSDELARMIAEAVDHSLEHGLEERLEPLYAALRETRRPKGVSVRDVIAGLGYIVGIFGLAIFLTERKKSR